MREKRSRGKNQSSEAGTAWPDSPNGRGHRRSGGCRRKPRWTASVKRSQTLCARLFARHGLWWVCAWLDGVCSRCSLWRVGVSQVFSGAASVSRSPSRQQCSVHSAPAGRPRSFSRGLALLSYVSCAQTGQTLPVDLSGSDSKA